jgi:hypothetical protein
LSFCASTNSGLTWTSTNISANSYSGAWESLVCSADGSKMAALFFEMISLLSSLRFSPSRLRVRPVRLWRGGFRQKAAI